MNNSPPLTADGGDLLNDARGTPLPRFVYAAGAYDHRYRQHLLSEKRMPLRRRYSLNLSMLLCKAYCFSSCV